MNYELGRKIKSISRLFLRLPAEASAKEGGYSRGNPFFWIASLAFAMTIVFWGSVNHADASGLVKAPNNFGMVGYWSMEDGKGTKATDFSGKGNIGTLTNMDAATDWVTGKIGKALDFDGTNDYVDMGTAARVIPASTAFSLSWWDQVGSSPSSFEGLFAFATGSKHLLVYRDGTDLYVTPHDGTNAVKFSSVPSLSIPNVWHHWVIVGTAGGESHTVGDYTLYIDGASQAAAGTSGTGSNASQINYIGHDGFDATWKGLIDEVRIYNRALSSTEVAALYAKTSQALIKNSSRGLVAHWTFEEGTGTATSDKTGNGNTGTLTNGPTWSAGKFGKGLSFDGSDDYVNVGANEAINSAGSFTLSAWINPTSFADYRTILVEGVGGGYSSGYRMLIDTNAKLTCQTGDSNASTQPSSASISVGVWSHVSCVWNGTNKTWYINGAQDSTSAATYNRDVSPAAYIGRSTTASNYPFYGSIDDVRIYNRALSAQEVSNLYNSSGEALGILNRAHRDTLTSGLVGYWSFDGPTMTTATSSDSSGQGNHGTLTGGPTRTIGVLGQAMKFDGTDDHVSLGNTITGLEGTHTSVSSWIKLDPAFADRGEIFNASTNGSSGNGIDFAVLADKHVRFYNYNASGGYLDSSTILSTNIWYHLVGVYEQDTSLKIYINGVQDATMGTNSANSGLGSTYAIGKSILLGTPFKGSIDEVRLYNRTLTAGEVLQLYNQGK